MTLILENLSPQTYQKLAAVALQHGRSVMEEATLRLASSLGTIDLAELEAKRAITMEEIKQFRLQLAAEGFRAMTQDELRAAIDEGRE